jgi:hypothetical protein
VFFSVFSLNSRDSYFCGLVVILLQHAKPVSKIRCGIPVKSELILEKGCLDMDGYGDFFFSFFGSVCIIFIYIEKNRYFFCLNLKIKDPESIAQKIMVKYIKKIIDF